MANSGSTPPKVFISYSHDSQVHKDRVLSLADRLRSDGIDCNIDQYEESPAKGWARWMLDQLEWADFVLVVCTKTYNRRFRGQEEPGRGQGVTWEGAVISQELYDAQVNSTKFIPVTFSAEDGEHIPIIIRGFSRYKLDSEADYEQLYRRLTNQHYTPKPELGKPKELPPLDRKQNFWGAGTFAPHEHPFYYAGAKLKEMGQDEADKYCQSKYQELVEQGDVLSGAWHAWAHLDAGQCVYNK